MSPLPAPPPDDPLRVVEEWLDEATRQQVQRHPNAMTLATVGSSSRPSARVMLIKDFRASEGYAVFHTHYGSRKGIELAGNAWAAGILHWDALGRQVRLEGPTVRSPVAESDEYFATRHWRSQINAWVSEQSRALEDPSELDRRAEAMAAELGLPSPGEMARDGAGSDGISRPPFWGGYRLWIAAVELWVEGRDRFHDRIRYERSLSPVDEHSFRSGAWSVQRVQP